MGVCERVSCVPRVCPCHPGERGSPRQEAGSWRIQICSPGRSFCIHQEAPGLIQRPTVVDAGERWGERGPWGSAPGQRSDLGGASSRGTCPLGGSGLQGAASGQERAPGGRAGSWGLGSTHVAALGGGRGGPWGGEGADPPRPASLPLRCSSSLGICLSEPADPSMGRGEDASRKPRRQS